MSGELEAELQQVRRLRARQAVDGRDELRLLARLGREAPLEHLKRSLGMSMPELRLRLLEADDVPPVAEGFSGADPYEIAQRYAAGLISREQVVDELVRWPYRPGDPGDGYDWTSYVVSEFQETVVPAADHGLIDDDVYGEIVDRRAGVWTAGAD